MSFGNHQVEPHQHAQVDCPLRVCHEDMHAVFCIFLIFTFRLEHEPLEYVVIPRDDAFSLKISEKKT
jgi:hypothetical protein